ncbi:peptidase family M49-domain-containing protein [Syncephalis fuscata]|nr:peptidase family M49-domain-containing protein [Syncephalis fuscata]
MTAQDISPSAPYYADRDAPICPLVIKEYFDTLTEQEKRYAHHISQASWLGGRVILEQTTPYSSDLFDLIRLIFANSKDAAHELTDLSDLRSRAGVDEDAFKSVQEYSAQCLGNLANFKSFGDVKFVPRVPAETFRKVVAASARHEEALPLFDKLSDEIYAVKPAARTLLGYPDDGHVTNYYSKNITKDDIKLVQSFCESRHMDPLNTRLFKQDDGTFTLRIASAEHDREPERHTFQDRTILLVKGDYHPQMAAIAAELKQAIPYAANDNQRRMLEHYVAHFTTGSIDEHKASQREWIRDIGPVVESNIGFVESYRDPAGVRAEFEGFVAVVNKEMTKKFEHLVNSAPQFIPKLPWGPDFEKDQFINQTLRPGINIPNYDDIRQTFGFKNVSLGNVLNAKAPKEKTPFLSEQDREMMERLRGPSFEVQVGIHELLGHGSGKLLQEDKDGQTNFPRNNPPINPLTGKPVEHWYGPGETWGSRFKAIAASYEECRAEAVAIYLSTYPDMLAIFGHTDSTPEAGLAEDVLYIGWLQMCRAGLIGLEFYDPEAKKWGQAHMQARYAILRVLLNAGQGLVTVTPVGDDDLIVSLDRSKIRSVGVPAIGHFLTQLQVYKATGDAAGGQALYDDVTSVPESWLPYRKIVLSKKQPRKLLLQANTFLDSQGKVILEEYPADLSGFIQSYLKRNI